MSKPIDLNCIDLSFYSLWLVNWPGGRVDWQEGIPGVLGWAELDGYVHPHSFSRVIFYSMVVS